MSRYKNTLSHEQVIGLDINDGQITAAWFHSGQLKRLASRDYSPEADDRQIARVVREMWHRERMPTRTVQTCLHSQNLLIRYFKYENISREELPNVLALEAEEALQCPIHQISLDWQLNLNQPVAPKNVTQKLSGTLVAAPKQKVQQHLKLIKAAGLYTVNVHVSYSALINLYTWLMQEQDAEPVCLINITLNTADIIMHSGRSNYPRTLFSAGTEWKQNTPYLLENIQNALLYYHLKLKHPPIKQILLTGQLSGLNDFLTSLSDQTSLPVKELDVLSMLPIDKAFSCKKQLSNQTTAISLGLRKEYS